MMFFQMKKSSFCLIESFWTSSSWFGLFPESTASHESTFCSVAMWQKLYFFRTCPNGSTCFLANWHCQDVGFDVMHPHILVQRQANESTACSHAVLPICLAHWMIWNVQVGRKSFRCILTFADHSNTCKRLATGSLPIWSHKS